ncbi:MAG: hypothetical protein K1X55_11035 [Chitinophagales bacterium]|nr:hypothetical protein [Chitinophagales bacterium]
MKGIKIKKEKDPIAQTLFVTWEIIFPKGILLDADYKTLSFTEQEEEQFTPGTKILTREERQKTLSLEFAHSSLIIRYSIEEFADSKIYGSLKLKLSSKDFEYMLAHDRLNAPGSESDVLIPVKP